MYYLHESEWIFKIFLFFGHMLPVHHGPQLYMHKARLIGTTTSPSLWIVCLGVYLRRDCIRDIQTYSLACVQSDDTIINTSTSISNYVLVTDRMCGLRDC